MRGGMFYKLTSHCNVTSCQMNVAVEARQRVVSGLHKHVLLSQNGEW